MSRRPTSDVPIDFLVRHGRVSLGKGEAENALETLREANRRHWDSQDEAPITPDHYATAASISEALADTYGALRDQAQVERRRLSGAYHGVRSRVYDAIAVRQRAAGERIRLPDRREQAAEDTDESRYEVGRLAILTEIADGTYNPETSPEVIAERVGLGVINVRQLAYGMLAKEQITWNRHPRTGMMHMALTESGEERLAQLADVC